MRRYSDKMIYQFFYGHKLAKLSVEKTRFFINSHLIFKKFFPSLALSETYNDFKVQWIIKAEIEIFLTVKNLCFILSLMKLINRNVRYASYKIGTIFLEFKEKCKNLGRIYVSVPLAARAHSLHFSTTPFYF
jgi:hypothetical protein